MRLGISLNVDVLLNGGVPGNQKGLDHSYAENISHDGQHENVV